MGYNRSGENSTASCLRIELFQNREDQLINFCKEVPVMPKERTEGFGECEDELAVREVEQNFLSKMLGEKQSAFLAAGGAEVETLARERPEVIVSAFRIKTAYPGKSQSVVSTGSEMITDFGNALQTKAVVFCSILIIKYCMQHITALRDICLLPTGRY